MHAEHRHLFRREPTYKQQNQTLAPGNSHWCQSHDNINNALRSNAKLPASRSSAPLLEVLSAYYEKKPERLAQDLAKRPKLGEFLLQDKSELRFKQAQLTKQEYGNFIKELKKANHGICSHLPGQLKTAWRSTPKESEVQQTARDSAPQHDTAPSPDEPSTDKAPNKSAEPYLDGNNPFAETDNTSDTTTTEGLGTEKAPSKSADSYPAENNPFAEADNDSDAGTTKGPGTEKAPSKSADSYPAENNPFADAEADSVPQIPPSNDSITSPKAPPSTEEHLPVVFLQLLNKYLKTKDGRSFGEINPAHVIKIKQDIASNPTIGKHLMWENEQLKWTGNNINKDDLQSLLDAFKARHRANGSLYQVLSQFSFVKLGFHVLDEASRQKIIKEAAEPASHRFGKNKVVEMKRAAMTAALKHFGDPKNHELPLPTAELNQLIEHYGRIETDLELLQQSLEKIKNELTLNDTGLLEAIQRFLHLVKTDERLKSFSQEVATLDAKLRTKMLSWLDRVQTQHSSKAVATRTLEMLNQHLKKAHDEYASHIPGTNTYPKNLNVATAKQIENQARQNSHVVFKEIIAGHEKKFVDSLTVAVSAFSVPEYFKGKSREKAVDNIIAINETLASLYEIAQKHRQENIRQIAEIIPNLDIQKEMHSDFENLQQGLADSIKAKVLNNYKDVFNLYDEDLENIEVARPGDFSKSVFNSKALLTLSKELAEDVTKIRSTSYENCPTLKKAGLERDLDQTVQKVTEPLLQKIRDRLPEVKEFGTTFKSAFKRAFKPTPAKILGGIPLIGGLTFALSKLPKVIAIPLGITAGVVLPFALLGWVGWNIYKRFDQRSEIKHLHTQTLKHLNAIESLTTK